MRTICFLFLSLFSYLATGQETVKPTPNLMLKVDVSSIQKPVEKIFVTYYNYANSQRFTDSALVSNGKVAEFEMKLDEPVLSQLRVVYAKSSDTAKVQMINYARDIFSVYLEEGKISVIANDSIGNSTVTGSGTHLDYIDLRKKVAAYDPAFKALNEAYMVARKAKDTPAMDKLELSMDSLDNIVKENIYRPYLTSPVNKTAVAIYALNQYAGYAIEASKTEPLYNQLPENIRNLPSAKMMKDRIDKAKKTDIGQYAIPFTQKDTAGIDVSLSSFKGKYVLIDFWASWCGPCRQENPNVVNAFQKYKENDFTVLGISLDQPNAKDKWLKAIYDDQLTWTHLSDLKFWNNEVAKAYGIQAIPQNYLLDKEGKIIGKNLRGEALQTTLKDLFTSK
ncbi:MAG: redoxin domain-containing protein [Bacteroidota bacterium]